MTTRTERRLTLYRDDSTSQVVYDRVKTWFWTAGNTVLVISRYDGETGGEHHYIHWPRERFCWFRDSDGSPKGGDGEAGSVRSTTARAEGIAQDQELSTKSIDVGGEG